MSKIIIYINELKTPTIIIPMEDSGLAIEEIAKKDVPENVPYLILDRNDVPEDLIFMNAWEIDMSNPHGVGMGHAKWFASRGIT